MQKIVFLGAFSYQEQNPLNGIAKKYFPPLVIDLLFMKATDLLRP
jgi:hypothetical protein